MKTSKILGFVGALTKNRKARIALVVVELGIMLYAYYKAEHTPEKPAIE